MMAESVAVAATSTIPRPGLPMPALAHGVPQGSPLAPRLLVVGGGGMLSAQPGIEMLAAAGCGGAGAG